MNGLGEWAEWCRAGEKPGPFGVLLRRDRGAGPGPARVSRPGRLSKLMMVLTSLGLVRVHLTTDSNAAEAGDGPLPLPGGAAS